MTLDNFSDTTPESNMNRRALVAGSALAAIGVAAAPGQASAQQTPAPATRVALVTGSSRGIGAAVARRLAREGYSVTVNYIVNRDLAASVVRDIETAGGKAIMVQADVSDPAAIRRLFDAGEAAFGRPDVVVANAGIMRLAPFSTMKDDDFNRMIDVNLKGGFYTMREGARRVRDRGRIITFSSSITQLRTPTYGPYAASKAAQELYANVLAKELAGRMISVNAIAPGLVNTTLFTDGKTQQEIAGFIQRTPHKRLAEPADIANVIAALCGDDGWWVSGQTVFANGGIV
jgi:3-oxoacyl-[acyl-carrier protein] reductase